MLDVPVRLKAVVRRREDVHPRMALRFIVIRRGDLTRGVKKTSAGRVVEEFPWINGGKLGGSCQILSLAA